MTNVHSTRDKCTFYRAEPDLLLQGAISQQSVSSKVTLGPCPVVDWKPTIHRALLTIPTVDAMALLTRGRFTLYD